jgi:hypothetical protein
VIQGECKTKRKGRKRTKQGGRYEANKRNEEGNK